jgi:hypothetical protein
MTDTEVKIMQEIRDAIKEQKNILKLILEEMERRRPHFG